MAIFDPVEQRLCIRIVYDGLAGAGKTTNLQQLATLFATQRMSEVYTPAELGGRTLYFDWVQIAAGAICGFPLLCQIISVPGHVVLTPRRKRLLAIADVVVYVCDSAPSRVEAAREGLVLSETMRASKGSVTPRPLLLQANQQDRAGALAGPALAKALGRPELEVVEAIASDGIGVVDTFVHAVRTVSRAMQAEAERGALDLPVRRAEGASQVFARLAGPTAQHRHDPELLAEMLLEDASAAYLFAEPRARGPEKTPELPADRVRLPSADVPTGFVWPAHTGRATLERLAAATDVTAPIAFDLDGVAERVIGGYRVSTTVRERYDSHDLARQALLRAARERTRDSGADTVLVAQPTSDGSCFLWTVTRTSELSL